MSTILSNIDDIKRVKEDIKVAIEEKGVDMTNTPFSGYAAKISEITGGGETVINVAEYGIKFANSKLTEIPEIFDFSNVTDYSYMFTNCKNLTGSPIGDSIVVNSGEYAFYESNIQVPSNIHINNNASTFNMIGGGYNEITTTNEYELNIVCDNFPFNIISNASYYEFLYITLGESYVPVRDGGYGEKYQLFNNFDGYYIVIKAQPDQELEWLLKGCTADTIMLGNDSSSFNYSGGTSDGNDVFRVNNCNYFYLNGDYSNYGWKTLYNGNRAYYEYIFDCIGVYGCKNLKGNFEFKNTNTDIYTIRGFINNIGSVPVEDDCYIRIPIALLNQLTEDEISIVVNKGYRISGI